MPSNSHGLKTIKLQVFFKGAKMVGCGGKVITWVIVEKVKKKNLKFLKGKTTSQNFKQF